MIHYPSTQKTAAGFILAGITVFIWGITFVSTKYLLRSYSALEILIVRFAAAYAGLWILSPHRLSLKRKSQEFLFIAAGISGVTVYQFMENMAISYTSASNVSIIVSVCPIFTAIIAQLFLHEKHISFSFFIGFILAISGIVLVSFNGTIVFHLNPKGDFLALGAAVCWGFYSLFVSKINMLGMNSIQSTRRIFFWALVFMIPITIKGICTTGMDTVSNGGAAGFIAVNTDLALNKLRFSNPLNWINILFLGLGASAFCFAAWNKACSFLGTVRATIGLYLIPIVTILFAFLALGEKITVMGALGAVLTIGGLVISEWHRVYRV